MTTCIRCKRALKDPLSVQREMGPICAARAAADIQSADSKQDYIASDIGEGVILRRDGDRIATNVPTLVVHHSPTGFEWGYGGSGPADLALNLCECILNRLGYDGERQKCWKGDCWCLAWAMHQDFKWQFIGSADKAGATLPYQPCEFWVKQWIDEHQPSAYQQLAFEEMEVYP